MAGLENLDCAKCNLVVCSDTCYHYHQNNIIAQNKRKKFGLPLNVKDNDYTPNNTEMG